MGRICFHILRRRHYNNFHHSFVGKSLITPLSNTSNHFHRSNTIVGNKYFSYNFCSSMIIDILINSALFQSTRSSSTSFHSRKRRKNKKKKNSKLIKESKKNVKPTGFYVKNVSLRFHVFLTKQLKIGLYYKIRFIFRVMKGKKSK